MNTLPEQQLTPATSDLRVRGTTLLATDTRERYREKIARITLDSMVQFVGLLDAQGTVLEINQVALDAVGIKLSDVEGKPFWTTFWWQVSAEVNQGIRDSIARAAQGEFVRWDTEIYGRAGGKETIIIDASLMPVKDEQGNVVFIAAEGRDITEKKAYEREIARQREELAQLDVLKTQFFANISHEFRTPLTLMLGPLEDTLAEEGLAPESRERLLTAQRNSQRLLKLVNTLLDFSRIEAGRIEAVYEPVDLATFTADLASVFRAAIERAGLELIVACPPLSEPVYVDREMWEKVVLNLLSNAFKFTFAGAIQVRLQQAGEWVELSVSDTGTGIPAAELPHVFERFHRVKAARGRSFEGSGIGLALVQELVRLHGGSVEVRSEIDQGSEFTVKIPLGKAHLSADRIGAARALASTGLRAGTYVEEVLRWLPEPASASRQIITESDLGLPDKQCSPKISTTPVRILLADDNADMRDYVRRLLGEKGYEVITVADGEEALETARLQTVDLVLTDVMMPKLDGFGLLKALRGDERTAALPVILLSARAGEESRVEGLKAGADDYLIKPFSARELLARVEASLKLSHLHREEEARTAADLAIMKRLHEVGNLCARAGHDFEQCLQEIVAAALAITGADKGDLQLLDATSGQLKIVAQCGFAEPFLKFFAEVDQQAATVCGAALQSVERVIVEDVTQSEIFRGQPTLNVLLEAGVRAVQTTPLVTNSGQIFGLISTHFRHPHRPSERDLRLLDLLTRQTADYLERKQAEEALRESEERFRAFVTASSDVVYRMSPDWSELRQLQGREFIANTDQPSGEWLAKYIHPEDQEKVLAAIHEAIRSQSKFELEHRVIRVDGTLGWTFSRAIPILGAKGEVLEWFGTASDITRRKQAEESLRESEEKYRTVLDSTDEGLMIAEVMFDETGKRATDYLILETNEAFYQHTGLPHGIVGKTIREIMQIDAVPWLGIYGEVAVTGQPIRFEYEIKLEPLTGWYDIFIQRIGKPGHHRIAVMFQEITERKRRELNLALLAGLQEDFARIKSVAEITQAAGVRIAEHLNLSHCLFVEINEAADEANVFHDQSAPGLPNLVGVYRLAEFHPEKERHQLASGIAIAINDVMDESRSAAAVQRFKSLSIRALTTAPYLSNGRWRFALSAQHQHPYQWRDDEIELLKELAARIYLRIERARAEEALRDADRKKDEFLAMLAHELRNPLAPIRNAVEILNRSHMNDPKIKWSGEVINRQVDHLTRLVDDLLDISRITRGKIELRKEVTDLVQVIGRALESSRPLIIARKQELRLNLPPVSLPIQGDVTRLAQVISNLLNNASKYSDEGAHIQLAAEQQGGEVLIRIRDDGIGIGTETLPHVFELFTQADRSLDRAQGGLGIGLTLVKRIVEMHGGKVEAFSDGPGKGSEFIVHLPVVSAADESSKSEAISNQEEPPSVPCCRILVVDDNVDSAKSMALLLELEGHEVQMTYDGPTALELAQAFRPQVMILDIGLPGMNGYEVARQLRSDQTMKKTVLIALTGYGQAEDRARSKEAGFDHHFTKPVDHDALLALIKSLIRE
ncbi:MAG TPA: ATP-binding protein [Blastocatellia bacterium]|nr:ATP-binding protein [Blastocatellia bacterium]